MSHIARQNLLRALADSGRWQALQRDCGELIGGDLVYSEAKPEAVRAKLAVGAVPLGYLTVTGSHKRLSEPVVKRWLEMAAEQLARHLQERWEERSSVMPGTVTRATRILRSRFRDPLQLGEVSAEVGLRRETLSRLFHQKLGITFSRYLTSVRVAEVKRMLETSDEDISSVALRCGFQSISQFNRQFKKMEGMSPSQYRQQVRLASLSS